MKLFHSIRSVSFEISVLKWHLIFFCLVAEQEVAISDRLQGIWAEGLHYYHTWLAAQEERIILECNQGQIQATQGKHGSSQITVYLCDHLHQYAVWSNCIIISETVQGCICIATSGSYPCIILWRSQGVGVPGWWCSWMNTLELSSTEIHDDWSWELAFSPVRVLWDP